MKSIDPTPLQSLDSIASIDHCIHVVDDDRRFIEVLAYALAVHGLRSEVYLSAEHFLVTYSAHEADCVLLDLRLTGMNGLELLDAFATEPDSPPILMLSAYAKTTNVVEAMRKGAIDYLVKPMDEEQLVEKVVAALRKNRNDRLRHGDLHRRMASLSTREREVMQLFVAAKTTIEVAHVLEISPKTVEKHRVHIFEKLNVDSVPALIRLVLGDHPE